MPMPLRLLAACALGLLAGRPGSAQVPQPPGSPASQQIQLLLNTDNKAAARRARQLLAQARHRGPSVGLAEALRAATGATRSAPTPSLTLAAGSSVP